MGPFKVRYADVEQCPTPPGTKTWKPIPHTTLIETTLDQMADAGLSVIDQAHALTGASGERYFGLFHMRTDEAMDDYGLVVGLTNSHDKTISARLGVGAGFYASNTLAFTGEIRFGRKHTPNILNDLPDLIAHAVSKLDTFRRRQDTRLAKYGEKRIRDKTAHDLVIRSLDANVISGSKIPKVIGEWREPTVEAMLKGKTVRRLHHAFSMALADCNVFTLPGRTIRLGNLLDETCGLQVVAEGNEGKGDTFAPKVVAA